MAVIIENGNVIGLPGDASNVVYKETSSVERELDKLNEDIVFRTIDFGISTISINRGELSSSDTVMKFNKTFKNAPLVFITSNSNTGVEGNVPVFSIFNITTTEFTIRAWRNINDSGGGAAPSFSWIAFGN